MKKIDPFILIIIVFSIILVLGGVFIAYKSSGKPIETYSNDDESRPRAKIEKTHVDLGTIKIEDIVTREIYVENIGEAPLQVTNVLTSCGCTSAQFIIGGVESPMFSMHNNPQWVGEINPKDKAIIKTIYEPSKMPIQGAVERTVFFKTNDPENVEVAIHFTANVE